MNKASPELQAAADNLNACFRLATQKDKYPSLRRALVDAQNHLAVAIIAMDEASGPALHEQVAVEVAGEAYKQALANLLRGDAS